MMSKGIDKKKAQHWPEGDVAICKVWKVGNSSLKRLQRKKGIRKIYSLELLFLQCRNLSMLLWEIWFLWPPFIAIPSLAHGTMRWKQDFLLPTRHKNLYLMNCKSKCEH